MDRQRRASSRGAWWKWLLGIAGVLALLAAGAYVVIFRVNDFSLSVQMAGEAEQLIEVGDHYTDPGAKVMLYGTLFMKDGVVWESGAPEEVIDRPQRSETVEFLSRFNRH